MGSASLYLLLSILTYQASCHSSAVTCCQTKTVKDAPDGSLDGEYVLKESASSKPHENCADGCVYTKGGEEDCFMSVPLTDAADIACDATTGAGAGATTPAGGEGATSPAGGAGATTPGGGAGAGATTPGGGAGATTAAGA